MERKNCPEFKVGECRNAEGRGVGGTCVWCRREMTAPILQGDDGTIAADYFGTETGRSASSLAHPYQDTPSNLSGEFARSVCAVCGIHRDAHEPPPDAMPEMPQLASVPNHEERLQRLERALADLRERYGFDIGNP